jgi:hypothetical protein
MNMMSQTGSELSMPDEDAVNPAENPGRSGSTDGSTVGRPRPAQQTGAVSDDQAGMWPQITMAEVLRSENMKAAYHRVRDNKGQLRSLGAPHSCAAVLGAREIRFERHRSAALPGLA